MPAPPRIIVSCNKRDEAFLAQVFDTHKPRNLETLEAFAISELAEELEQDPQELAQAIRERQRKQRDEGGAGCKPLPERLKHPGDNDEDVDAQGKATRHSGGGGAVQAAGAPAIGHDVAFTHAQHGNAGKQRGQATRARTDTEATACWQQRAKQRCQRRAGGICKHV